MGKAGVAETSDKLKFVGHFRERLAELHAVPIPHDRAMEIHDRLEAREREHAAEIATKLEAQFKADKAQALQQAATEAELKVAAARDEARAAAESAAKVKLDVAERASADAVAAQERAQTELTEVKAGAEAKEAEIRREVAAASEAAALGKVTSADTARAAAEEKALAAQAQIQTLRESQESELQQRLTEQREALETAKTEAVNAEKAAAFKEALRLSAKVEELQRTIEKKTAEELGEGAEINLYDALKGEFDGDRIERVKHGLPGADIVHTVIHNGKECGTIIYDSKNHGAWRSDFVTKLKTDQMAAKAEHAILSTSKFPAGGRQLQIIDGVVVASPARIVAIVQMVRQHLIQTHTLRLSAEQRTRKTDALYDFITSERCGNLLTRFDTNATGLLDLQEKERKAHEAVWKQQGILISSVQKVSAELSREIDEIIGSHETAETTT